MRELNTYFDSDFSHLFMFIKVRSNVFFNRFTSALKELQTVCDGLLHFSYSLVNMLLGNSDQHLFPEFALPPFSFSLLAFNQHQAGEIDSYLRASYLLVIKGPQTQENATFCFHASPFKSVSAFESFS